MKTKFWAAMAVVLLCVVCVEAQAASMSVFSWSLGNIAGVKTRAKNINVVMYSPDANISGRRISIQEGTKSFRLLCNFDDFTSDQMGEIMMLVGVGVPDKDRTDAYVLGYDPIAGIGGEIPIMPDIETTIQNKGACPVWIGFVAKKAVKHYLTGPGGLGRLNLQHIGIKAKDIKQFPVFYLEYAQSNETGVGSSMINSVNQNFEELNRFAQSANNRLGNIENWIQDEVSASNSASTSQGSRQLTIRWVCTDGRPYNGPIFIWYKDEGHGKMRLPNGIATFSSCDGKTHNVLWSTSLEGLNKCPQKLVYNEQPGCKSVCVDGR